MAAAGKQALFPFSHSNSLCNPSASLPPLLLRSPLQGIELGLRAMAAAGAETVLTLQQAAEARFSFTDAGLLGLPAVAVAAAVAVGGSGDRAWVAAAEMAEERSLGASGGGPPAGLGGDAVGGSAGKARAAAELAERGPMGEGPAAGSGSSPGGGPGAGPAGFGEAFEQYVAGVRQRGVPLLEMPVLSAHQMGTCRLGECLPASVRFLVVCFLLLV